MPKPDGPAPGVRPSVMRSLTGAGAGSGNIVRRVRRWPFFHRSSPSSSDSPSSSQPASDANDSASTPAEEQTLSQPPPPPPVVEDAALQVSVLIAMPSRYKPRAWEVPVHGNGRAKGRGSERGGGGGADSVSSTAQDEEDLPEVVFGVAEVPWKVQVTSPGMGATEQQRIPS